MATKTDKLPDRQHARTALSFGRGCATTPSVSLDAARPSVLSLSLPEVESTRKLVRIVKLADAPVVVGGAQEEVMVAMTPRVFERILLERSVQLF